MNPKETIRKALEEAEGPLLFITPPKMGKLIDQEIRTRCAGSKLSAVDLHNLQQIYHVVRWIPPESGRPPYLKPDPNIEYHDFWGRESDPVTLIPHYGKITLAYAGYLFLDGAEKFNRRDLLDNLCNFAYEGVTEHGYPIRCQIVLRVSPCPCGKHGTPDCHCEKSVIRRHFNHLYYLLQSVRPNDGEIIRLKVSDD